MSMEQNMLSTDNVMSRGRISVGMFDWDKQIGSQILYEISAFVARALLVSRKIEEKTQQKILDWMLCLNEFIAQRVHRFLWKLGMREQLLALFAEAFSRIVLQSFTCEVGWKFPSILLTQRET